jgi:hypothetical protein
MRNSTMTKYDWILTDTEKSDLALYIFTFQPNEDQIKQFVLELIYKNHRIEG